MCFVEKIKLSNQILHPHLSILFRLGIRAILALKMGIENSSFFFIPSLFNKIYHFTPKIVVLEHRDHFFRIPRVISDQNTLFQLKKIRGERFFIISYLSTFITFFMGQMLLTSQKLTNQPRKAHAVIPYEATA